MNEQSTYSISELSKEFGITTRTLRFYEDKGMLQPTRTGSKRIYSMSDRTRLKLILRGKRIGLSLEESFEIIQLYRNKPDTTNQLKKLLQVIEKQKELLEDKKQALKAMEQEIQDVEAQAKTALASHTQQDN